MVSHSFLNIKRSSLSEILDQGRSVLSAIINSCFFEAIYDPLVIRRGDVNFVLFQLLYLFLSDFVILDREGPELFFDILSLSVHLFLVMDVEIRDCLFTWGMRNMSVFQETRRIFEFNVGKQVREIELDRLS